MLSPLDAADPFLDTRDSPLMSDNALCAARDPAQLIDQLAQIEAGCG
ncbi:hypothetical protein WMF27_12425 [Sorangium sp. So ce281]